MAQKSWGFGVCGDICVTGCVYAKTPRNLVRGRGVRYPCSGFVISEELARVGGVEGLAAMCKQCPANVTPDRPAGCAGTISLRPGSAETQQQLDGNISALDLEAAVREAFLATQPWWYGFWARSPLAAPALKVLGAITERILHEGGAAAEANLDGVIDRHLVELESFGQALGIALTRRLDLHVSMDPPGHADFGFYTVFPHCPLCKAAARMARWQEEYPTQLYACHVCGTEYSPAQTVSSVRMEEEPELREMLGPKFREFARTHLMEQGLSESEAAEFVEATEQAEADRQARLARRLWSDE